jgi:photosystem II stability/assembly factor-like uncharacterized protein
MKKYTTIGILLLGVFFFSGCSLLSSSKNSDSSLGSSKAEASSFLKTTDGGKTWEAKVKISDTQNISSADILSLAIDSKNTNIIYAGSASNGLLVSKDGAETWQKLNFPTTKIYGLAIDKLNGQNIYASGVYNSRAKIYKSANSGTDWQEIYTEPANGTIITSLAMSQSNSQLLYVGTDQGAIFSSGDGGQTWKNIFKAENAVVGISFSSDNSTAYFAVYTRGILRLKIGSDKLDDLTKNAGKFSSGFGSSEIYSVATDPSNPGTVYLGLGDGILKSKDFGENWEKLNILESSSKYPVWALGINPKNSNEIVYSGAGAIYKSTDGGNQWSTFQLASGKSVRILRYDPNQTNIIYAGLKKE